MGGIRMKTLGIAAVLIGLLWLGVGVHNDRVDEAYIEGYEVGIDEVCQQVRRKNAALYYSLRNDKVCF